VFIVTKKSRLHLHMCVKYWHVKIFLLVKLWSVFVYVHKPAKGPIGNWIYLLHNFVITEPTRTVNVSREQVIERFW